MFASKLFFPTLKESPAQTELISHQLMLRAGLIRKLASGLYTWLPLGLRILHKIIEIIRFEMNASGGQEILMPAIQPAELWHESKRFEQYGPELLKMQDRHKRAFCFGPTHEEVITDLIRNTIQSYKSLPLCLYQIQTKFRDEIRPRFGVIRAREFIMKDAYSFHADEKSLKETYQSMFETYTRIFTRLGLHFRAVLADSGHIGGNRSEEFHVLANSGEDVIVFSDKSNYAANKEQAITLPPTTPRPKPTQKISTQDTANILNIADQAKHLNIEITQMLKTILVKGSDSTDPVIGLIVRADHEINEIKAEKIEQVQSPLTLIDEKTVLEVAKCQPGFVGPIELTIPLYADYATQNLIDFACGANTNGRHYVGANWGIDCKEPTFKDLRNVESGDPAPDKGHLKMARGIEVGHIFQLGNKYALAMQANILNDSGRSVPLMMGCYGIGVSRIVAASIEQNHDSYGIDWPEVLAPFQVVIIAIDFQKSSEVKKAALSLYTQLQAKQIEVLLDERLERPGVKFAQMDLIGIPHHLILGQKSLAKGKIEYKNRRTQKKQIVPLSENLDKLINLILTN